MEDAVAGPATQLLIDPPEVIRVEDDQGYLFTGSSSLGEHDLQVVFEGPAGEETGQAVPAEQRFEPPGAPAPEARLRHQPLGGDWTGERSVHSRRQHVP